MSCSCLSEEVISVICVTAGLANTYVRYKQVQALLGPEQSSLHSLNRLGLVLGSVSSSGMCVVANFQVTASCAYYYMAANWRKSACSMQCPSDLTGGIVL